MSGITINNTDIHDYVISQDMHITQGSISTGSSTKQLLANLPGWLH